MLLSKLLCKRLALAHCCDWKRIVYEKSLSVELHLLHKIDHLMSVVAMCDGWLWYSIACAHNCIACTIHVHNQQV